MEGQVPAEASSEIVLSQFINLSMTHNSAEGIFLDEINI